MVSLKSSLIIPREVLVCDLDEESVVLNLRTGIYYGLSGMAAHIWALAAEHGDLGVVFNALVQEYDVSEHELKDDLISFINDLEVHGLISVNSE
jgi:Coenzyme PQQ synthesis protein D (PqqD)